MRPRQLQADLVLLGVTLIWGATFTMVKAATATFPVFAFLALRFALALLVLAPLAWRGRRGLSRTALWWGSLAGLCFFAGYAFQTFGLRFIGPGRAGFITGLSVVLVPLGSALLLRRSPSRRVLTGVVLATGGLFLLSWSPGGGALGRGDWLTLGCAIGFGAHILVLGSLPKESDWRVLTALQTVVVLILSLTASLVSEPTSPLRSLSSLSTIPAGVWGAAGFTGLLATALALGLQTWAQRFTSPTHTALIFAAEPVFAALFGYLLVAERLGGRQLAGCALILLGMMAAELPGSKRRSIRHD